MRDVCESAREIARSCSVSQITILELNVRRRPLTIEVGELGAVSERSSNRLSATVVLAAGVTLLAPYVRAEELPWTKQDALHEASSEAAQCAAYYAVAKKCAENGGRLALSNRLQRAFDSASELQFFTGRAAGMTKRAMRASLKLSLKVAEESIRSSCVNISVLIVKYSDACKFLLEHPDDRIQILMNGPPRTIGQ